MRKCWWRGKFEGAGLRLTSPRLAIIDILSKTTPTPVREDIYLGLRQKFNNDNIGLTTVYRTLEILVNNKLFINLILVTVVHGTNFRRDRMVIIITIIWFVPDVVE